MERIYRHIALRLAVAVTTTATVMSCNEADNPIPARGTEISYSVDVNSRAQFLYTRPAQIEQFYAYAITPDGKPYIPGDLIARQADDKFSGEYDRYWPEDGAQLAFGAVVGADKELIGWYDGTDGHAGIKITDYKIVRKFEEQTELLVASTGLLSAPDKSNTAEPVNLKFNHALCQIELRARNIDPAIDVEINGIGLKHIQDYGTLTADFSKATTTPFTWTLPNVEDPAHDTDKPTYTILFDHDPVQINGKVDTKDSPSPVYSLPQPTSAGDNNQPVTEEKYMMLAIPQPLFPFAPKTREHGASLMLHATIWNVADDSGKHSDGDKLVWGLVKDEPSKENPTIDGQWMMIPLEGTWEPGKRYTYTITFGGEGTHGGYEVDEQNPNKDRVFDPIGFTIEIESWVPGGDIVQNIY